MNLGITLFLGIFQILIQILAVYYSYKIYMFNRLNKGWLALTFGLGLMVLRRITASLIELKAIPSLSGWIAELDRMILPTIISICLLIGIIYMFKNFEYFDVVEKKIKAKIKKK